MVTKLVLPVIALGMLIFAITHMLKVNLEIPYVPPPVEPARSPFGPTIAGYGLVEAQTENIAIASELPGVVREVWVKVGQKVSAGAPLFRLDDRQLRAELKVREAGLAVAQASLKRLESMPRPEE